ncbi:MAG: hypothetical protein V1870_05220 [Candidatus Aenigmatarchaeota archaeon]
MADVIGCRDDYRDVLVLFGSSDTFSEIRSKPIQNMAGHVQRYFDRFLGNYFRDDVPVAEWEISKTSEGHVVTRLYGKDPLVREFLEKGKGIERYFANLFGNGSYRDAFDFMSSRAGKLVQGQTVLDMETWHEYSPALYSRHSGVPVVMLDGNRFSMYLGGSCVTFSSGKDVANFLYDNGYNKFECVGMTKSEQQRVTKDIKSAIRFHKLSDDSRKSALDDFLKLVNEYECPASF